MNFAIFGGLLGAFVSSWVAPKAIAWYFVPPVDIGVNCGPTTEWSMQALQRAQLLGLVMGIGLSLTLSFYLERQSAGT